MNHVYFYKKKDMSNEIYNYRTSYQYQMIQEYNKINLF